MSFFEKCTRTKSSEHYRKGQTTKSFFFNFSGCSIDFCFIELQSKVLTEKSYVFAIFSVFVLEFVIFLLTAYPYYFFIIEAVFYSLINYEDNELLGNLHCQFEAIISNKSSVSRALPLGVLLIEKV